MKISLRSGLYRKINRRPCPRSPCSLGYCLAHRHALRAWETRPPRPRISPYQPGRDAPQRPLPRARGKRAATRPPSRAGNCVRGAPERAHPPPRVRPTPVARGGRATGVACPPRGTGARATCRVRARYGSGATRRGCRAAACRARASRVAPTRHVQDRCRTRATPRVPCPCQTDTSRVVSGRHVWRRGRHGRAASDTRVAARQAREWYHPATISRVSALLYRASRLSSRARVLNAREGLAPRPSPLAPRPETGGFSYRGG